MTDTDSYHRLALVSSFALGIATWGGLTALFAPGRWFGQAVAAGVGAAVTTVGVSLLVPHGWLAAVAGVLMIPFGVADIRHSLYRLARPRLVGGAVAVMALAGVGVEGWRHDTNAAALADEAAGFLRGEEAPATRPAAVTAWTDLGTPVELHDPVAPRSAGEAAERDRTSPVMVTLAGRFIRRGPADDQSNCHGWVFAAGRYHVGWPLVETILADNGYAAVGDPQAGDVCVYRSPAGQVLHTAVVRGVLDDGTVMVEGKWGRLGVYLHAANDSCYGTNFTFHRSGRCGHTLAGLDHPSVGKPGAAAPNP